MIKKAKVYKGHFLVCGMENCKRCGHEWITRLEGKKPLKCPKCMNPNWNKEKKDVKEFISQVKGIGTLQELDDWLIEKINSLAGDKLI